MTLLTLFNSSRSAISVSFAIGLFLHRKLDHCEPAKGRPEIPYSDKSPSRLNGFVQKNRRNVFRQEYLQERRTLPATSKRWTASRNSVALNRDTAAVDIVPVFY